MQRGDRLPPRRASVRPANLERLSMHHDGRIVGADAPVHVAENVGETRLDQRLFIQITESLSPELDQIQRAQRVQPLLRSRIRVRRLEEALQKLSDCLGGVSLPGCTHLEHGDGDRGRYQEREESRGQRDAQPVSVDEFAGPIRQRVAARLDGLAGKVTLDVGQEGLGRRVPSRGCRLHRLQHDRIQIPAQASLQSVDGGPTAGGDVFRMNP